MKQINKFFLEGESPTLIVPLCLVLKYANLYNVVY